MSRKYFLCLALCLLPWMGMSGQNPPSEGQTAQTEQPVVEVQSPASEAWEQTTRERFNTSYLTLKENPGRLERALAATGLSPENVGVPGCENDVPPLDRRDQKKRKPENERTQTALKQFPFVRVREYSGEKLVPWFKTPNGKLWADRRSIIRICIDPTALVNDGIFSQGDVSLGAQLGDREISVDGYAEVGKNYEKFKPAALRPERFVVNYATISAAITNPLQTPAAIAQRAPIVSDILASMLNTSQATYAITRIAGSSEEDIKARAKALKDAITRYETVNKDRGASAAQTAEDITKAQDAIADLDREILKAVEQEADLAANPNADAKKKEAARTRTVELGALHAQRRTELRALQARNANLQNINAAILNAENGLRDAFARVGSLFSLTEDEANARIIKFTSNLRPGQIFLRKEDAKRGDVLRLMLLHFPPDFKADAGAPLTQTLTEVNIDEFGWKTEVVDSFLLVRSDDEEAKSNFSGAAGVSLLWSPQPRARRGNPFGSTIRGLRPSIGANVSYLDFDQEKELEIGAGVIVGLFENQIHFGYGWNLNYDKGDRNYIFLGFSFGKIQEKLTGGDDDD